MIDAVKRATLSRLLLENITSKAPGEKLDEKLAALVTPFNHTECSLFQLVKHGTVHVVFHLVPYPSSDETAWWDAPG